VPWGGTDGSMTEPLEQQVRQQLGRYVRGELSVRDFNRWFMPATWGISRTADASTRDLIGTVGLALAELSAGHATEAEIREEFAELVASPLRSS
jgi:hypothetical protein